MRDIFASSLNMRAFFKSKKIIKFHDLFQMYGGWLGDGCLNNLRIFQMVWVTTGKVCYQRGFNVYFLCFCSTGFCLCVCVCEYVCLSVCPLPSHGNQTISMLTLRPNINITRASMAHTHDHLIVSRYLYCFTMLADKGRYVFSWKIIADILVECRV